MSSSDSLEFLERLALSDDRKTVLQELAPDTEPYFFHNTLFNQVKGDLKAASGFLQRASERGYRQNDLSIRQALLEYDSNKKQDTLKPVSDISDLNFSHSRVIPPGEVQKLSYPTKVDEKALDFESLMTSTLARQSNSLSQFTPLANEWLAKASLSKKQLRDLLGRVSDPILPNLPNLIAKNMKDEKVSFGSNSVDRMLTAAQTKELKSAVSELADDENFVAFEFSHLMKDSPNELSEADQLEFLRRAWKFVSALKPKFNSMKYSVLYQLLSLQAQGDVYDEDLFMEYIKLPRSKSYVFDKYLDTFEYDVRARTNTSLPGSFSQVPADDNLVRTFLEQWFRSHASDVKVAAKSFFDKVFGSDNPEAHPLLTKFTPYLSLSFLKTTLAETKVLYGHEEKGFDEQELGKWLQLIPGYRVEELRTRIDLKFAKTKQQFDGDEPVELHVYVKNVKRLKARVFEINTRGYYDSQSSEITADINLDGLTPHEEFDFEYSSAPFDRVKRLIAFPSLQQRRGVFVIELLGNGKNCRALIRKGSIQFFERVTSAGHVFRLFDEQRKPILKGSIKLGGHSYVADELGEIVVPFSGSPSFQSIQLSDGVITTLGRFNQKSETYQFSSGFFVDREALLQNKRAEVVVRPSICINGTPTTVKLLENVVFKISSLNDENTPSTKVVTDFKLSDQQESVYAFAVQENVRQITFELNAEVRVLSTGARQQVSASRTVTLNQIDSTGSINCAFLRFSENGYCVQVLGKAGEPRPYVPVRLRLTHTFVTSTIDQQCQTDVNGRVGLGQLTNVSRVTAEIRDIGTVNWNIDERKTVARGDLNAKKGDKLLVPYEGDAKEISDDKFALLKYVMGHPSSDETKRLALSSGFVVLPNNLEAGTYKLIFKERMDSVWIQIDEGVDVGGGFLMCKSRYLQVGGTAAQPLHIVSAQLSPGDQGSLTVQLANYSESTRVHIVATHFTPEWGLGSSLSNVASPPLIQVPIPEKIKCSYMSEGVIGDEYRYILDRRQAVKSVGNMLERASLLLNARVKQSTQFEAEVTLSSGSGPQMEASAGGIAMSASLSGAPAPMSRSRAAYADGKASGSASSNIEFLSVPSTCMYNLKPNSAGLISVPAYQLSFGGIHTNIQVVACDRFSTVTQKLPMGVIKVESTDNADSKRAGTPRAVAVDSKNTISLADPVSYCDIRLLPGLDVNSHVTEQHVVSVVRPNQSVTVHDIKSATVETYDSMRDVWNLYTSLATKRLGGEQSETLKKFDFVMDWPSLSDEAKEKKYSEFSCHELNFFIMKKDKSFFDRVVKPYIANKLESSKSFMDRFLLGQDLSRFLPLHVWETLNTVEKILLASVVQSESKNMARRFADLADILPKDNEAFIERFNTAIQTKRLNAPPPPVILAAAPPPPPPSAPAASQQMFFGAMPSSAPMMPPPSSAPGGRGGGGRVMKLLGMAAPMQGAKPMAKSSMMESNFSCDDDGGGYAEDAMDFDQQSLSESASLGMPRSDLESEEEDRSLSRRSEVRQLYRPPESTKEYEELGYYLLGSSSSNSIPFNNFWADFAQYALSSDAGVVAPLPFLSQHVVEAGLCSFSASMLALAVIDLPFEAQLPLCKDDGYAMVMTARTPIIVFHKEVGSANVVPSSVAVSQNYFDPVDQFTDSKDGPIDKYIEEEFLPNKVYCCRVVLTNVSSRKQNVEVLHQIPQGSMPVGQNGKSFRMRTFFETIEPYSTKRFEYSFYFPAVGSFTHYPVHVSKTGQIIGHGQPKTVRVVRQSTLPPDLTSWPHVSQNGSEQDVIKFLNEQNVHKLQVDLIAWRMKSKPFFLQVLDILRQRRSFSRVLWSYSFLHEHEQGMTEYLAMHQNVRDRVGPFFKSGLLSVNKLDNSTLSHLEYSPMINERAHRLHASGSGSQVQKELPIRNKQFKQHYRNFLTYVIYAVPSIANLEVEEIMCLTYYLLLQDRIDEGVKMFSRIKQAPKAAQLQYDYLRAYVDFFNPNGPSASVAGAIAKQYVKYPVVKKRKLFVEIAEQLAEIGAAEVKMLETKVHPGDSKDDVSRDKQMSTSAMTEPSLEFTIEDKKILLQYANLKSVNINFYFMDIELLFSTSPFLDGSSKNSKFLCVAPNRTMKIDNLTVDKNGVGSHSLELPSYFNNNNVYVEVQSGALSRSQAFYSHSLTVQVIENYGQVKVTNRDTGKPVPASYIKVYAQTTRGEEFYKDGYTDLRGRFDYTSLSADKLSSVSKFSILVLSDQCGAVVKTANPPAR